MGRHSYYEGNVERFYDPHTDTIFLPEGTDLSELGQPTLNMIESGTKVQYELNL